MSKAIVCIAESQEQAKAILNELMSAGFSRNDISVIDVSDLVPDKMVKTGKVRGQRPGATAGTRPTRASQKIFVPAENGKDRLSK
jgi:hypothetical protein